MWRKNKISNSRYTQWLLNKIAHSPLSLTIFNSNTAVIYLFNNWITFSWSVYIHIYSIFQSSSFFFFFSISVLCLCVSRYFSWEFPARKGRKKEIYSTTFLIFVLVPYSIVFIFTFIRRSVDNSSSSSSSGCNQDQWYLA